MAAQQLGEQLQGSMTDMPVDDLRRWVEAAIPKSSVGVERVLDTVVEAGSRGIPIRVYRPVQDEALPVLVWFHSGGFAMGSPELGDDICRRLANEVECIIVSIDYRLAPEHPYPAALEDGLAVYNWVQAAPELLGPTLDRIGVAGESAGGNLAMALALKCRDCGLRLPDCQVSIYGTAEMRISNPEYGDLPFLTNDDIRWFWHAYLAEGSSSSDPYVSPAAAPDLSGLSPLLVLTAEHDPTRDATEEFARRVEAAGGEVELRRYLGVQHGFLGMAAYLAPAREALRDCTAFLQQHLQRASR